MGKQVLVYDPTANDPLSKVRGIGRYLQILRENFPKWHFVADLKTVKQWNSETVFINPFFNFLQNPLTFRRIAKTQIAIIHDLIPLKYPKHFSAGIKGRFNIFRNKLALKNYDLIITDSHSSKRDIIQLLKIKEERIKVIYPCLPKLFTTTDLKFKDADLSNLAKVLNLESKFCVYVGDVTWNKNLVNLARAVKEINVTCVFIGKVFSEEKRKLATSQNNKWLKEYQLFLKETDTDKRFIFLGFVADKELIQLYKQATCNILISRDEGFGFSYLEAASQHCPSILANTNVLREISKNKGALFAKAEDINSTANNIGELYFNREVRNKLGKQAQDRARFFTNSKFVNEFSRILET